ncbi:hypothetical protein HDV02_004229, partial [Globomyces sp. JEL0801]
MTSVLDIPYDILETILQHLHVVDYHHYRLSHRLQLPLIPHLSWIAYTESSWYLNSRNIPINIIRPRFHTIMGNQTRLNKMLADNQFQLLQQLVLKSNQSVDCILDTQFKYQIFFKSIQFGILDLFLVLYRDPLVDPCIFNHSAIRRASYYGFHEILEVLLNNRDVDPSCDENYPIRIASERGHDKCVTVLLRDDRVDPTAGNNYALKKAISNG